MLSKLVRAYTAKVWMEVIERVIIWALGAYVIWEFWQLPKLWR